MEYTISTVNYSHLNSKLTIKENGKIILCQNLIGNQYYDIFERKDGTCVAYGGSEEFGFNFLNITKRWSDHCPQLYKYRNVCSNPTGEYLVFIDENGELEVVCIRKLGKTKNPLFSLFYAIIVDKTGRWYDDSLYYTFKDSSLDCVEWVSDYKFVYTCGTYHLVFDVEGDKHASLEWHEVTLFSLLSKVVKNDNIIEHKA